MVLLNRSKYHDRLTVSMCRASARCLLNLVKRWNVNEHRQHWQDENLQIVLLLQVISIRIYIIDDNFDNRRPFIIIVYLSLFRCSHNYPLRCVHMMHKCPFMGKTCLYKYICAWICPLCERTFIVCDPQLSLTDKYTVFFCMISIKLLVAFVFNSYPYGHNLLNTSPGWRRLYRAPDIFTIDSLFKYRVDQRICIDYGTLFRVSILSHHQLSINSFVNQFHNSNYILVSLLIRVTIQIYPTELIVLMAKNCQILSKQLQRNWWEIYVIGIYNL